MRKLQSYLMGAWHEGAGEGVAIRDAVTGEELYRATSEGLPLKEAVAWGREVGGKALLALGLPGAGKAA
jgi:oxepin-CoA hydrolase/3-oxo-5,6-dehydrosuberyl-CoA semialdehyde dehydrogenase